MNWQVIWEWLKDPLPGLKTYIAAFGLLLHGLYQITQGNLDAGWAEVMAALAALGLRKAIDRDPPAPTN